VSEIPEGGNRVDIMMTLTAPGCGMGEILKSDIETKVLDIPGITVANIDLVFDPPWESAMMSEAARLQLGMM
jgi:metal-sulfur cluster biosynthetic enzyme